MVEPAPRGVPDATVGRLPGYLRALTELTEQGVRSISSEDLAAVVGVRSAQLRKDLSHLGSYGVRGVGYDVAMLSAQIAGELGLADRLSLVVVGMGNLGRALSSYDGFTPRGFEVVALVDEDPQVIGTVVGGRRVVSMADLRRSGLVPAIGVVTTPAHAAQHVVDELVALGVRSILNFAPCRVEVPEEVAVRTVDVATELLILAFHHHHRADAARDAEVDAG